MNVRLIKRIKIADVAPAPVYNTNGCIDLSVRPVFYNAIALTKGILVCSVSLGVHNDCWCVGNWLMIGLAGNYFGFPVFV